MNQPSDYFLGAVLRAYDAEAATGLPVTPSGIWTAMCCEAVRESGAFIKLFEWDTRKARMVNRIGTIKEVIACGQVPGLRLGTDERGRWVVRQEGRE